MYFHVVEVQKSPNQRQISSSVLLLRWTMSQAHGGHIYWQFRCTHKPNCMTWTAGGDWCSWWGPTQAWGELANSTWKGPNVEFELWAFLLLDDNANPPLLPIKHALQNKGHASIKGNIFCLYCGGCSLCASGRYYWPTARWLLMNQRWKHKWLFNHRRT